jgi:hypothetical protein
MEMFVYLILAAIAYWVLAERTDRSVDRVMRSRRDRPTEIGLVEDVDRAPKIPSSERPVVRRSALRRAGVSSSEREAPQR